MSAYDDALRLVNGVYMAESTNAADATIAAAQVYATLAVADALDRLADRREPPVPAPGAPEAGHG